MILKEQVITTLKTGLVEDATRHLDNPFNSLSQVESQFLKASQLQVEW